MTQCEVLLSTMYDSMLWHTVQHGVTHKFCIKNLTSNIWANSFCEIFRRKLFFNSLLYVTEQSLTPCHVIQCNARLCTVKFCAKSDSELWHSVLSLEFFFTPCCDILHTVFWLCVVSYSWSSNSAWWHTAGSTTPQCVTQRGVTYFMTIYTKTLVFAKSF